MILGIAIVVIVEVWELRPLTRALRIDVDIMVKCFFWRGDRIFNLKKLGKGRKLGFRIEFELKTPYLLIK